jgi:hypothetical protein
MKTNKIKELENNRSKKKEYKLKFTIIRDGHDIGEEIYMIPEPYIALVEAYSLDEAEEKLEEKVMETEECDDGATICIGDVEVIRLRNASDKRKPEKNMPLIIK